MNQWKILKYVLPLLVLCLGVYSLWLPLRESTVVIREEDHALRALLANQSKLSARLDSFHTMSAELRSFHEWGQGRTLLRALGMDSLRKAAEEKGIEVRDMMPVNPPLARYANQYRFDLEAPYGKFLIWLDAMEALSPTVQIQKIQWTPGRESDRLNVELGNVSLSFVQQSDSSVAQWLRRAYFVKQWRKTQADTGSLQGNPFAGRVVQRPVAPHKESKISTPPRQPAPVLSIMGLVAGRMATVVLPSGERKLLRVGDAVGDWIVKEISASSVTLGNGSDTKTYNAK